MPAFLPDEDLGAEYADTLADIDETLLQWALAMGRSAHYQWKADQQLASLSADQRQILTERGAVYIGKRLYLVSQDQDGHLALRFSDPLLVVG